MTREGREDVPSLPRWLFGYGSLIWRPDFPYRSARVARLEGWVRRFWQGSHDHRGVPHAPGRVVTLVPEPEGHVEGIAFEVEPDIVAAICARLDIREANGYERRAVPLVFRDGTTIPGITYIAPPGNRAFLGPDDPESICAQVLVSEGPSGRNRDYVLDLARALRAHDICDPHVFDLEDRVRAALPAPP